MRSAWTPKWLKQSVPHVSLSVVHWFITCPKRYVEPLVFWASCVWLTTTTLRQREQLEELQSMQCGSQEQVKEVWLCKMFFCYVYIYVLYSKFRVAWQFLKVECKGWRSKSPSSRPKRCPQWSEKHSLWLLKPVPWRLERPWRRNWWSTSPTLSVLHLYIWKLQKLNRMANLEHPANSKWWKPKNQWFTQRVTCWKCLFWSDCSSHPLGKRCFTHQGLSIALKWSEDNAWKLRMIKGRLTGPATTP